MADGQNYLAFMRVTLLGAANSGKSSLVNNVVNNTFSPTYSKTTEASLYYTVVRIFGEQDSLLEIEDTFGSSDVGIVFSGPPEDPAEEREIKDFYNFWWPSTFAQTKKEIKALVAKGSNKDPHANNIIRTLEKPVSMYKAPVDGIFKPLSKNRMAFLIIFDANDEDSYKEAVRVFEGLVEYHEKKQEKGFAAKPLIMFVANKIDKDPTKDVYLGVIASAQSYCDFNGVPLRKVSALQFQGVKKLFRSVVQAVRAKQQLWMMDLGGGVVEEEEEGAKCTIA